MSLLEVHTMLRRGDITHHQAAETLGLTPKDLAFRLTRWGKRLPLLLRTLDKIQSGKITRAEAAEVLQVSPRQINHLMESWKVDRPLSNTLVRRVRAKVKWEIRKKFAIDFIANSCTIMEAAENAGVCDRQMRRWVSDLLQEHYGMVYKDLRDLPQRTRNRLADEIETKEGLELAKQQVLQRVAKGEKDITDEAVERIMARRTRRT